MADLHRYDPNFPVPYWHQDLELVFLCISNSLSLTIIGTRLWLRYSPSKAFRADDYWIIAAGATLIFPHWACQLATNRFGSGLHIENLTRGHLEMYWQFSRGWIGYFLVCSMIKVSVCYCLLGILPETYRHLRLSIRVLVIAILGLGGAESLIWVFQCQPFLSNFVITDTPTWCADVDIARYAWVGASVTFDAILTYIPCMILKQVRLEAHKRNALMIVFGANLLGSITCLVGVYGIWVNRNSQAVDDVTFSATPFVIINDIEILMYTIGASATVGSKYLVSKAPAAANFLTLGRQKFSKVVLRQKQTASSMESSAGNTLPNQYARRTSDDIELIEVKIDAGDLQHGESKPTARSRPWGLR